MNEYEILIIGYKMRFCVSMGRYSGMEIWGLEGQEMACRKSIGFVGWLEGVLSVEKYVESAKGCYGFVIVCYCFMYKKNVIELL